MDLEKHLENLKKNPNGFAENYNLGIIFHQQENLSRAKSFFKRAIEIDLSNKLPYNDLGTVYTDLNKPKLALKYFKKAINLDNKFSDAFYNIGFLYSQYKFRQNLAKKYFEKAYSLDSKNSKALAMYYQQVRGSCNFPLKEKLEKSLDKLTKLEIEKNEDIGESPFLHLTRKQNEIENFYIAKSWSRSPLPQLRDRDDMSLRGAKATKQSKLKVGYVSDGLRDFPTGHNLSGVLANHTNKVHLNIYTWGNSDGSIYEKIIKKRADNYVDISNLSDEEASQKISFDKIDILIDLKGFTKNNRMRVFSFKTAPITVNYLGYPGTTGSNFHNYLIADKIVIPIKNQKYFSEKIIYLPHSYRPADVTTPSVTISKSKNKNSKFIFGSINSTYKIDKEIYQAWLEILKAVPNSEMWILADNKDVLKNLAHKQIKFLEFSRKDRHLERLSQIDLCLDTKVVSGHTTTTDAARVNVPTLCLKGNHFASRVSESINQELGLEKLIAKNLEEYIKIAIDYANKKVDVSINKKSIIFDPKRFAKSLEKVYFSLYKSHEK